MVNLFDILQQSQGGQGMDNLARSFGLTPAQTQAAVEALLPAFSMGLKRQTAEPAGLKSIFGMMNADQHRSAFEDAVSAFNQQATGQGNAVLGSLFGSKDVSRAIADQAALASGVGANVLKAMLPVLATMLMGGLARSAQAQPGLEDIFGQLMGAMMGAQGAGSVFGNAGSTVNPSQVQPNANGGGLLGALLGSILAQGNQQAAPPPPPATPQGVQGADIFGQMLETGRQVQDAHMNQLQSIFEAFLGKK